MRVGIFGGSFNPIHNGHLGIARQALADWLLDLLYVVPAKVSPFKTDAPPSEVECGFSDAERMAFVRAACEGEPRFAPWEVELERGGTSYAIDTVRLVRERHPGAEVFFVIGEDSVAGLPKWKDWPVLSTLCRFVSYPRTRESSTEIRRLLAVGEDVDMFVPSAIVPMLRLAAKARMSLAPIDS